MKIVFWCERRNLLCSHINGDMFTCEDNVLFSHVKISSFRGKAHLVFHWCLYNKVIYLILIRNCHRFILRCTCVILIYFQLSLPSVSLACPPRAQDQFLLKKLLPMYLACSRLRDGGCSFLYVPTILCESLAQATMYRVGNQGFKLLKRMYIQQLVNEAKNYAKN